MKNNAPAIDENDDPYSAIVLHIKLTVGEGEEYFGIEEYHIDIEKQEIYGNNELIGKLHAFKFVANIVSDIENALDYESATAPFMMLFNENEFISEIQNIAEIEGWLEDFLILDRLEILPQFRGKNYTRRVFEIVGRTIGHNTIAAIKAFPLQLEKDNEGDGFYGKEWQEQMQLDELPKNAGKAKRSLISYYEKLGFQKLKISRKENFLIRSYLL